MREHLKPDYVKKAKGFAELAHHGQTRKFTDEPYFRHVERVAQRLATPEAKQVGYLHDVLEDTPHTEEELRKEFPQGVVDAVVALTRQNKETYFDFILRVQRNPLAVEVKVADLSDNMSDLKEGSLKDKYRLAYFVLTGRRPEWDCPVRAECHSDDHNIEVQFDAVQWLAQAKTEDIVNLATCGWRGDYPADKVAEFMADKNDNVDFMFKYLEVIQNDPAKKDVCGFECSVNEEDAMAWLKIHSPEIYKIICDLQSEDA